jgi:hypothetical protein
MLPTAHLDRCPYIRQVLAAFDTVIGRTRLMCLKGGERVAPHCDLHYYWHDRVRVHVPIVTHPAVHFLCDDHEVHMAAGEAWVLDTWRIHGVINASSVGRVHLVFDTVGSSAFWDLVSREGGASTGGEDEPAAPRAVPYDPRMDTRFVTERYNLPVVMPPAELEAVIAEALGDATPAGRHADALERLAESTRRSTRDWRAVWAVHGEGSDGWPAYRALQERAAEALAKLPDDLRVRSNGQPLARVLRFRIGAALNPGLAGGPPAERDERERASNPARDARDPASKASEPPLAVDGDAGTGRRARP